MRTRTRSVGRICLIVPVSATGCLEIIGSYRLENPILVVLIALVMGIKAIKRDILALGDLPD
jgi:hypothetical protein